LPLEAAGWVDIFEDPSDKRTKLIKPQHDENMHIYQQKVFSDIFGEKEFNSWLNDVKNNMRINHFCKIFTDDVFTIDIEDVGLCASYFLGEKSLISSPIQKIGPKIPNVQKCAYIDNNLSDNSSNDRIKNIIQNILSRDFSLGILVFKDEVAKEGIKFEKEVHSVLESLRMEDYIKLTENTITLLKPWW
jgi:disulfide oxidoreductase YuzD